MKTVQKLTILLIAFLALAPTGTADNGQSAEAVEFTELTFDYLKANDYKPELYWENGQVLVTFTVDGYKIINIRCINEVNDKGFIIQFWLSRDLKELGFSNEKGLDVANEINLQYARVKSFVTADAIFVVSYSFMSNLYQFKYQIPDIITAILAGDDIILKRQIQGN